MLPKSDQVPGITKDTPRCSRLTDVSLQNYILHVILHVLRRPTLFEEVLVYHPQSDFCLCFVSLWLKLPMCVPVNK